MDKPMIRTGAPGDEQDYRVRQGGLRRCCLLTLAEYMAPIQAGIVQWPQEGNLLPCRNCSSPMIFTDGAWEWNRARAK